MNEIVVEVPTRLTQSLDESFEIGAMDVENTINEQKDFIVIKHFISWINGVKVEIFSKEHSKPHFRVKYQNSCANFRISDCKLLEGSGEVLKYGKNIKNWWRENKQSLIKVWNDTRPSDCPVGEYREQ